MTQDFIPSKKKVLMVDPEFFEITYSINPYMTDSSGELNKVDKDLARLQWQALGNVYRDLGLTVHVLSGEPKLPDMVFCANQSLPFWSKKNNRPEVILSNMAPPMRREEVKFFRQWYAELGYKIHEIENKAMFLEGNGDLLTEHNRANIWAASGSRTSEEVANHVEAITGYSVNKLKLQHPDFFHLDTCFSILDDKTICYLPEAFDEVDVQKIKGRFSRAIEISLNECRKFFAANCHSPDGKHVILQKGAVEFCGRLKSMGFEPIEVETSEFIKAGGSVFCLKMMFY